MTALDSALKVLLDEGGSDQEEEEEEEGVAGIQLYLCPGSNFSGINGTVRERAR